MECVLCGRAADTSHVINDLTHHTRQQVIAHEQNAHSVLVAAPQRQQQTAVVRQLIGRMEIVSVVHTSTTSTANSQSVDVEDDEWT